MNNNSKFNSINNFCWPHNKKIKLKRGIGIQIWIFFIKIRFKFSKLSSSNLFSIIIFQTKMNGLINTNFNRTYNPTGQQNALGDIKRLLTSRDTTTQAKACGYLIEVIRKYDKSSIERSRLVNYLLENDITVFLCEVTSNLDFNLFR